MEPWVDCLCFSFVFRSTEKFRKETGRYPSSLSSQTSRVTHTHTHSHTHTHTMLLQVVGLYERRGTTQALSKMWEKLISGMYKRRENRVVVLEDGKWWYGVLAGLTVTHCLSGLSPSNCTAYVCTRLPASASFPQNSRFVKGSFHRKDNK